MIAPTDIILQNDFLHIRYNSERNLLVLSSKITNFFGTIELNDTIENIQLRTINSFFGQAESLKIRLKKIDVLYFELYPNNPFLFVTEEYGNSTIDQRTIHESIPIKVRINFQTNLSDLKILGVDGLTTAETARSSYTYLAVANPQSSHGLVAGWISQEIGSGIVFSNLINTSELEIYGKLDFGNLRIDPQKIIKGDTIAFGFFNEILPGLELYADMIAKYFHIHLPPIKGGYCTWYIASLHYGAGDEKTTIQLAEFCAKELVKFGFEVIQIDDKWQAGPSRIKFEEKYEKGEISGQKRGISYFGPRADFTKHDPKGPYPNGMKVVADKITTSGMKAGIWLMPFAWDPLGDDLKKHHDWFVHKSDKTIYQVNWAGWCLDMTHPDARNFLGSVISRITNDWGYRYLKMDALWAGLAARQLYTQEPNYFPDGFGDAIFYDQSKTNIQAIRDGLKTIRASTSNGTFLQACSIAQNMRSMGAAMGLVDGIRIGRDIEASWQRIIPNARVGARLYFLNGRVWWNDPDCLMLRKPLTLKMARAWGSFIAISGQLNIVSEWLPSLPEKRLEVVKRSMPMSGLSGRPLDLFNANIARIWHLADTRGGIHARRDILAFYNWKDLFHWTLSQDLNKLKIPGSTGNFVGFDYWCNKFIDNISNQLSVKVFFGSCHIIAIRPETNFPQVISTSRHITQGIVDLTEESWSNNILSGKSAVVGGDLYELRIIVPSLMKVTSIECDDGSKKEGTQLSYTQVGRHVRVQIAIPMNRDVIWSVQFK